MLGGNAKASQLETGKPVSDDQGRFDEDRRWRHELEREDFHRSQDEARRAHDRLDQDTRDASKAAIESATLVFRTAVLINGGAAVSVLAFLGGLISQGKLDLGPRAAEITFPLVLFALGVLSGTFGMGCAYFTNSFVAGNVVSHARQWEHPYVLETPGAKRWRRVAMAFYFSAIMCGLGAAAFFVGGVLEIRHAIMQLAVKGS